MVTAVWMFAGGLIVLVGVVFVGLTLHHHWSTWADRQRAGHLEEK